MKRLITVAVLALLLGSTSLSFADSINVFGVSLPIEKSEVRNEAKGGEVEKDFISFYVTPKTAGDDVAALKGQESDEDNDYIVFGVKVNADSRS